METSRLSLPQAVSFRKTTDGTRKERNGCDPDVESGFSKELTSKLSVTQIKLKYASMPTKLLVRCQAQIEPVAAQSIC
jgi:hypothetical protein